jgi:hypothetical protein
VIGIGFSGFMLGDAGSKHLVGHRANKLDHVTRFGAGQ